MVRNRSGLAYCFVFGPEGLYSGIIFPYLGQAGLAGDRLLLSEERLSVRSNAYLPPGDVLRVEVCHKL